MTLILRLRCEHPGVPADQTLIGFLKIEEGQTQPVDGTRRSPADPMVNHQPASGRLDGRRRHANFVCIPPSAPAGLHHELLISPVPQIGRASDPNATTPTTHRPTHKTP